MLGGHHLSIKRQKLFSLMWKAGVLVYLLNDAYREVNYSRSYKDFISGDYKGIHYFMIHLHMEHVYLHMDGECSVQTFILGSHCV